jgi:hypothetical protein
MVEFESRMGSLTTKPSEMAKTWKIVLALKMVQSCGGEYPAKKNSQAVQEDIRFIRDFRSWTQTRIVGKLFGVSWFGLGFEVWVSFNFRRA